MSSSSQSTPDISASALALGWAHPELTSVCAEHGLVSAPLHRGNHEYGGFIVEDTLAYVCPSCERALAFPAQSTGRLFLGRVEDARSHGLAAQEFRVSKELEDLALCVHAHLGTNPTGDIYSLPLHLGLRLASELTEPDATWRVTDKFPNSTRARPVLLPEIVSRLDGLIEYWDAESRANVFRWLVVAAWRSITIGIPAFVEREHGIQTADFVFPPSSPGPSSNAPVIEADASMATHRLEFSR